jgi:hypothetical protein
LSNAVRSACRWYPEKAKSGIWFSPARAGEGDWAYLAKEKVRVLNVLGTLELFVDEVRELNRCMKADGVDVELYEVSLAGLKV